MVGMIFNTYAITIWLLPIQISLSKTILDRRFNGKYPLESKCRFLQYQIAATFDYTSKILQYITKELIGKGLKLVGRFLKIA